MANPWRNLAALKQATATSSLHTRQWEWLKACLHRNRDTEYGRAHGFANINSIADFQNRVPVTQYEQLAPLINRVAAGEQGLLFHEPAIAFERTGGSSGGAKLIPYTATSLADFRNALVPWLADTIDHYQLSSGCAYWAISPATRAEEKTAGGMPIGLPDGAYLGEEALASFAELSAVPYWLATLTDVKQWHIATLYYLIRRDDLALVSVWSPSFFLHLIEAITTYREALSQLLKQGGDIAGNSVPKDIAAFERLRLYQNTKQPQPLWPKLKLISCWADASSKHFFNRLQATFPNTRFQGKGLLATEGVMTVPNVNTHPVLTADSGFYEFENSTGNILPAHALQESECYEVLITTAGGLYRYRLGDQVRCCQRTDKTLQLQFTGRHGLVSDLVGEKLTETFVSDCMKNIKGFRMLFAEQKNIPHYRLIADKQNNPSDVAMQVEQQLRANPQYDYARRIGQLGPLQCTTLKQPLSHYLDWGRAQGRRLGDIKPPALCTEKDCLAYLMERGQS